MSLIIIIIMSSIDYEIMTDNSPEWVRGRGLLLFVVPVRDRVDQRRVGHISHLWNHKRMRERERERERERATNYTRRTEQPLGDGELGVEDVRQRDRATVVPFCNNDYLIPIQNE